MTTDFGQILQTKNFPLYSSSPPTRNVDVIPTQRLASLLLQFGSNALKSQLKANFGAYTFRPDTRLGIFVHCDFRLGRLMPKIIELRCKQLPLVSKRSNPRYTLRKDPAFLICSPQGFGGILPIYGVLKRRNLSIA